MRQNTCTRTAGTRSRISTLAAIIGAVGALSLAPTALARDGGGRHEGREQRASAGEHRSGERERQPERDREGSRERSGERHRDGNRDGKRGGKDGASASGRHGGKPEERGRDREGRGRKDAGHDARDGHGGKHGGGCGSGCTGCDSCRAPGAGILTINGCSYQIGNDNKLKKIAKAFEAAGYEARVRTNGPGSSVRVYGFPRVGWDPGKVGITTTRSGNVLDVAICK